MRPALPPSPATLQQLTGLSIFSPVLRLLFSAFLAFKKERKERHADVN